MPTSGSSATAIRIRSGRSLCPTVFASPRLLTGRSNAEILVLSRSDCREQRQRNFEVDGSLPGPATLPRLKCYPQAEPQCRHWESECRLLALSCRYGRSAYRPPSGGKADPEQTELAYEYAPGMVKLYSPYRASSTISPTRARLRLICGRGPSAGGRPRPTCAIYLEEFSRHYGKG